MENYDFFTKKSLAHFKLQTLLLVKAVFTYMRQIVSKFTEVPTVYSL